MDTEKSREKFGNLLEIVAKLRSPEGCPWDRAQTLKSIAPYLLEETHEVLEAIHESDAQSLRDELGDLMLEVALLSRITEEEGGFTILESLEAITEKLIRRHPHVFGEEKAEDAKAVGKLWSEIKAAEKPDRSVLGGVPKSLPALHRAQRVSEKAAGVGFDWPGALEVLAKVEEECAELRMAINAKDQLSSEEELGDLFFALVNLGRHLGVNSERALNTTTDKFLRRFAHIEASLARTGRKPSDSDAEEMERYWIEAKKIEKGEKS